MKIKEFFDPTTYTLTYIVFDENTLDGVIIDPVLDYDQGASKISTQSLQHYFHFIDEMKLKLHAVLETHAHADHLSGAQEIKKRYSSKIYISARIREVQKIFKGVFNLAESFNIEGKQFDHLLENGETLRFGALTIKALATPGHTPACMCLLIEDSLFTGDALFMPDLGTGRCDFPAGSASDLYDSVTHKIYSLPDQTKIYVGHDYQIKRSTMQFQTTVGEQKRANIQLGLHTSKEDFISARNKRDKELSAPRLLLPSIQININAGQLPEKDANGVRFLKIPIG